MNRFFFSESQKQDDLVVLEGEDARHLTLVLRAAAGSRIELCDEQGACREAEVLLAGKKTVTCRLLDALPWTEPGVAVTLAFSLLKGEKNEFILQKATELGVKSFLPFTGERTVARVRTEKGTEKMARWQKIVRSAAAQSKRSLVPDVAGPLGFGELIDRVKRFRRVLFLREGPGGHPLRTGMREVSPQENILLITGPEGGFSDEEAAAIMAAGACQVTLGSLVLRAETAAVVAVALALYEAGELGGKA